MDSFKITCNFITQFLKLKIHNWILNAQQIEVIILFPIKFAIKNLNEVFLFNKSLKV